MKVKQLLGRRYDVKSFLRCANRKHTLVGSRENANLEILAPVYLIIVILGSTPVRLLRNSILVDRSDGINECQGSFTLGHLSQSQAALWAVCIFIYFF